MRQIAIFLSLLAAPALAQDYLDEAGFDAVATGHTITYNDSLGMFAGVEAYHPNRRVTWVADGGTCQKGRWFPQGSEICFVYEGSTTPVCWGFRMEAGRLLAEPSPGAAPWVATSISTEPIACQSPFVGS